MVTENKNPLQLAPNEKPWFEEGLKFSCTGCGKCCTGAPGYVWVTLDEIQAIADYLNCSVDDFARSYLREINGSFALKEDFKNYDCVFLDGKQCRIYPVRPKQCKTFPWWVQNLETKEDWEMAARRCEGINLPGAPVTGASEILQVLEEGDGIHAFTCSD